MGKVTHRNERQCVALVGRQAVGKSSLITEMVLSYVKRGGKARVYSPHPAQFGAYGILCNMDNINDIINELLEGKFQGLVVFDDCDTYMGPQSAQGITAFCSTFRHYDCDIVVSSRSPQQININLRRCFTLICVFKMHEPLAIKSVRGLLGEFTDKQFKVPSEKYEYYEYDLEEYTVFKRQTKQMRT